MIKVENVFVSGWDAAIRGMRNPLNSWAKSDSYRDFPEQPYKFVFGDNDKDLAMRLCKAGPEHRKFLRMVHVSMDITAPMFWWSEFDTYKVATTRNSCSKMHKIHAQEFTWDDFSFEGCSTVDYALEAMSYIKNVCERLRKDYNATNDRDYWRSLIELLPEGYLMKATWDGSMETVLNIMHQRDGHKLKEEWEPFRTACFEQIPYLKEFYDCMTERNTNGST